MDSSPTRATPARTGTCPNCGAQASGTYCSECGRVWRTALPSLRTFLVDLFEDVAGVEKRLLRTLRSILVRPGTLTADYAAGRGAIHMGPVRTYLLMGLAYFAASSLVSHSPGFTAGWGTFNSTPEMDAWTPRLVFAAVPLLAVVLKTVSPSVTYVAHFVFAFHYSAFVFLSNLVLLGLRVAMPESVAPAWLSGSLPLSIWQSVYLFLALRRVHSLGTRRGALMTVGVLFGYALAIAGLLIGLGWLQGQGLTMQWRGG